MDPRLREIYHRAQIYLNQKYIPCLIIENSMSCVLSAESRNVLFLFFQKAPMLQSDSTVYFQCL